MGWPYEFVSLTSEEKHARREVLAWYGFVAHCSALAPVLAFGLAHLARLLYRYATGSLRGAGGQGLYAEVPNSPAIKAQETTAVGRLQTTWARLAWWLGDEVRLAGTSWGRRDEWILGLSWTAWLLLLCTLGTGKGQDAGARSAGKGNQPANTHGRLLSRHKALWHRCRVAAAHPIPLVPQGHEPICVGFGLVP